MKQPSFLKIDFLFKGSCMIATISIIVYWIHVYRKNEDVSHIEVKSIETMKEITIPELSLCLIQPFLDEKLHKISPELGRKNYASYLVGEFNVTEMYRRIDFDNVTIDLVEHLGFLNFTWRNGSMDNCTDNENCPFGRIRNSLNLLLWKRIFTKCFTLELNHYHAGQISGINLMFKPTIMSSLRNAKDVVASWNFPGQMLTKLDPGYHIWNKHRKANQTEMISIGTIEIIERRNTMQTPCIPQEKKYDEYIMNENLKKVGCKAPYHITSENISICKTSEKMMESAIDGVSLAHDYPPPCRALSGIFSRLTEVPEEIKLRNHHRPLLLRIWYADKVKIITQFRQVDFQTLVGYIGGYIGLILGKIL